MVSPTLHLVQFIGNSYTIWLTLLNLNHTHCRLSLSLDTNTVEGQHTELLMHNQGIYLL